MEQSDIILKLEVENLKLLSCIRYILNEAHSNIDDSLVDIANEAFDKENLRYLAEWADSDDEPINLCHKGPVCDTEIKGG